MELTNTSELMKNEVREDFNAQPEKIYRKCYANMPNHYKDTYTEEEFTAYTQTFYSLKTSFYRIIPRPPLPTSREDIRQELDNIIFNMDLLKIFV